MTSSTSSPAKKARLDDIVNFWTTHYDKCPTQPNWVDAKSVFSLFKKIHPTSNCKDYGHFITVTLQNQISKKRLNHRSLLLLVQSVQYQLIIIGLNYTT